MCVCIWVKMLNPKLLLFNIHRVIFSLNYIIGVISVSAPTQDIKIYISLFFFSLFLFNPHQYTFMYNIYNNKPYTCNINIVYISIIYKCFFVTRQSVSGCMQRITKQHFSMNE